MSLPDADPRLTLVAEWLATTLRSNAFTLAPASEDASFRRYFRVTLEAPHALAPGAATLIAMDAPPPREDCRPFVHVAALMDAAGIHAPRVLAQDLERGFLLLTDLGPTTYLRALDADNANDLFGDAVDALLRWQLAVASGRASALRRGAAAPGTRTVPGMVCRSPPGPVAHAAGARGPHAGLRDHHRVEPRAADGVRAPRLHAAQPDGVARRTRACWISRTPCTARSPTTSRRCFATRS